MPPAPVGVVTTGAARSPGTAVKHYAPRAELHVWDGDDAARVRAALAGALADALAAGRRVGLLLSDEDLAALGAAVQDPGAVRAPLGPAADVAGQARHLFAALRDLDAAGADLILARMPPPAGLGLTLRDRLRRAASGRVETVP